VDFFRNTHGEKIAWNLQLEKGLFAARFDEAKMQQALTKILENAVEAVSGSGKISVQSRNVDLAVPMQDGTVRLAAGTYACVDITDSGAGIAPEVLPRIFEPFFTTKGKNHRGLGLALVYGHRGRTTAAPWRYQASPAGACRRGFICRQKGSSSTTARMRIKICTARKRFSWWMTR